MKIGSIHGKLNYDAAEKAFHKDDVPGDKRARKIEVLMSKQSKILSTKREVWNASTYVGEKLCEKRKYQLPKHDPTIFQYNYRTEVLPQSTEAYVPKPRKFEIDRTRLVERGGKLKVHSDTTKLHRKRMQEMEVHPNLQGKVAWDFSTSVTPSSPESSRKEVERCLKHSRKQQRELLTNYRTPLQREQDRMQKLREEKIARANGTLETKSIEQPQQNKDQEDSNELKQYPFRFRSKNHPSRRYKEYYNDGAWEFSHIEQRYVWSCSMNPNPDFRGSSYRIRNPDAWNFASP